MVRRFVFLCALTVALCTLRVSLTHAQRPAGDAASFAAYLGTEYVVNANLTYLTASGMELKLDIYRPRNAPAGLLPTAMFFHGGGYSVNAKKEASALNVMPYVQMGWNAVNVEYRRQTAGCDLQRPTVTTRNDKGV